MKNDASSTHTYPSPTTSHLGLTPPRWWEEEALVVEAGKLEGDVGMRKSLHLNSNIDGTHIQRLNRNNSPFCYAF